MNRFTGHRYEHDLFRDIYCKLQDLEDLEEEIGMSLLELFRILKCGKIIYKRVYEYKRKIVILETRDIDGLYYDGSYYILKIHNILEDDNDNYDLVYVKDYGITYALTKEELEDDKWRSVGNLRYY